MGYNKLEERNGPYSDISWAGIASDDFDDDGKAEIFAVANSNDGNHCGYYLYEYESGSIQEITRATGWGSGSEFVGATSGDFNGDGISEYASVRNLDNDDYKIKTYHLDNGNHSGYKYVYTSNIDGGWIDITAGDIDGDCKDELLAISDCETAPLGDVFVVKMINDEFAFTEKEYFRCNEEIPGIGCGNVTGDNSEELVYSRNFDGDFLVYSHKNPEYLHIGSNMPSNNPYSNNRFVGNTLIIEPSLKVKYNESYSFTACDSIVIHNGFEVEDGGTIEMTIENISPCR